MALNPLNTRRIFYLQDTAGKQKAAFVIDGRQYITAEKVEKDCAAAFDYLDQHWLVAESVLEVVEKEDVDLGLPTWQEYLKNT